MKGGRRRHVKHKSKEVTIGHQIRQSMPPFVYSKVNVRKRNDYKRLQADCGWINYIIDATLMAKELLRAEREQLPLYGK